MTKACEFLKAHFVKNKDKAPDFHIVLGSGLSSAFDTLKLGKIWEEKTPLNFGDIPSFSASTAPGHKGVFRYFTHAKSRRTVTFQVGRLHGYEGLSPRDVVKPVMESFLAGTRNFILTNAAGSLKKSFKPGSVMLIEDHVNLTGSNPLYGPNPVDASGKVLGPRFPDMSQTYDPYLLKKLKKSCEKQKLKVNHGVYLGLLGPCFETPAEVKLFASWGLGAVGMSTVWEAIALKHAGAKIGGLSFMSNLGCGLDAHPLLHEDVEKMGKKIAPKLVNALFHFVEKEFNS